MMRRTVVSGEVVLGDLGLAAPGVEILRPSSSDALRMTNPGWRDEKRNSAKMNLVVSSTLRKVSVDRFAVALEKKSDALSQRRTQAIGPAGQVS
jgi:hypothetical protein